MGISRVGVVTIAWTLGLGSCTGVIEGASPEDEAGLTTPTGEGPAGPETSIPRFLLDPTGPDQRPGVRRLSKPELAALFEAISGIAPDLSEVPVGEELAGLRGDAASFAIADPTVVQAILRAATEVARRSDLDSYFACGSQCTSDEIRRFLENAFTRPVEDELLETYRSVYDSQRLRLDHDFARRAVMQAALLSPFVLYRTEVGVEGTLTASERAKKLSYFLWGLPPDAQLTSLALDGSLADDGVFEDQAERMLADPRTERGLRNFIYDWLGLDHVALESVEGFDRLPNGFEDSMVREVDRMIDHVLFEQGLGLRQLFLQESTFVDASLAEHYGLEGAEDLNGFSEVSLAGTERQGILTTALVLASHGKANGRSPMQRGAFVVGQVLCTGFPLDAGPAQMSLPQGDDVSFRERFQLLEQRSDCGTCHRMINVGFAFDIFDNVGRRWPEDFVSATEATGQFDLAPHPAFSFDSTREAVAGIAAHPALGSCFTAQLFRHAQGTLPNAGDAPLIRELEERFDESNGDVRDALRTIVYSDRFRSTRISPPRENP